MVDIGRRLCEERNRLRLNQKEFGDIGGVVIETQSRYETGKRKPDMDYLAKIAAHGVDIQYVITGVRSGASTMSSLTRREEALVETYRGLADIDKDRLQTVVDAFAEPEKKDALKRA
uniref:HTH cro/C1-type domain-containing protein n=1 Tax=Candidatus Kentrum sp. LFY TaxID=2126342 RepID=A0A450WT61_9GAMM|nr:MAG: hypothetical protein BECKLFY1418C_GA0070996_106910 [Candidatus Kentron sp. LFY]